MSVALVSDVAVRDRAAVVGDLVELDGDRYYRIANYDEMRPFFISLVTDSDLWMYVSSHGSPAAGRCSPNGSIFPYETVDRIHRRASHCGPVTLVRVHSASGPCLWRPFAEDGRLAYDIERNLYKHVLGCSLIFEEVNRTLGLVFRARWDSAERFGWIRTCELEGKGAVPLRVELLDGVQDLMPAELPRRVQDLTSCLADAYKRSELDRESRLAVYALASCITDHAEAREALRATTAWSVGLPQAAVTLDADACGRFARGLPLKPIHDLRGGKGAYLLQAELTLQAGATHRWRIVLDTGLSQAGVSHLQKEIQQTPDLSALLQESVAEGRARLERLLAGSDAFQSTGDAAASAHHAVNTLYNIARGGTLLKDYRLDPQDWLAFVQARNRQCLPECRAIAADLPSEPDLQDLVAAVERTEQPDLLRLGLEYLPIGFSRRHGDPSRPWNDFAIRIKNADGSPSYSYQGNWRDIFQNWEALSVSFPECIESMIAKFVNATSLDGFNPYRVTREGIDWEIPNPDDPWSSIGYWGDHQIVYLLKLLERSRATHPGRLESWLDQACFSYADIPYDIRPFADLVSDPQDTIEYNRTRQATVDARVRDIGTDGRLVHKDGLVYHVNLAEKLLVPILAKLCNLVPEGGIWLNTLRPEWNDANNALVGNGLSVVTACYLRRHLVLCRELLAAAGEAIELTQEVADWLKAVARVLAQYAHLSSFAPAERYAFLERVGEAFSEYRCAVYARGISGKTTLSKQDILGCLEHAQQLVEQTIAANRRSDGLYHAYNLLHFEDGAIRISHLYEMLEGQVAVLSSGLLGTTEALHLLAALRHSRLYRADQRSYLLYPARDLPSFFDKNVVPEEVVRACPSLADFTEVDAVGRHRFKPEFQNARDLWPLLEGHRDKNEILAAYEQVFNHKSFTGRSGGMYGYEGIGCIYWHMVAKLLLAVQETLLTARTEKGSDHELRALTKCYYDIRAGLGFCKPPAEFGAFPLDPYSHTPRDGGARQPGMTGQVKEEILARFGELGVAIWDGAICFEPVLLRRNEFSDSSSVFRYVDSTGEKRQLRLETGCLAFTLCQVPVVYRLARESGMEVEFSNGESQRISGSLLPAELARLLFSRSGEIGCIRVAVRQDDLVEM